MHMPGLVEHRVCRGKAGTRRRSEVGGKIRPGVGRAGIALLAVALKDAIARPPSAEPGLAGAANGAIPLAFPIMFSPAVASLAIAAAEDRGLGVALVGVIPALMVAVLLLRFAPLAAPQRRRTARTQHHGHVVGACVRCYRLRRCRGDPARCHRRGVHQEPV